MNDKEYSTTIISIVLTVSLIILILVNWSRHYNRNREGFTENTLVQDLISSYDTLTDDEKAKLSEIFGVPVHDNDTIPKSAIPPRVECPKCEFEMGDYVKRSSIPPCPEQKPCIAPKVVIDGELCKQQECPPCPTNETVRVEKIVEPVFLIKTVNEDGKDTIDFYEATADEIRTAEALLRARSNANTENSNENSNDTFTDFTDMDNMKLNATTTTNNNVTLTDETSLVDYVKQALF